MVLDFKKVFWLSIFVFGLVCGTLCVNYFMDPQTVIDIGKSLFFVDNFGAYGNDLNKVIHIAAKRIILFVFLAGSALLCRKSLVLCVPTAFFGSCFGVVISMVTLTYDKAGILRLFWYLMPHYLFYIAAFCVILKLADCAGNGYKKYRYMLRSTYGGRNLTKLILLVLAGIMSECYVNQWIIEHFVKKI